MQAASDLTQGVLKSLLTYDPETGAFASKDGRALGSARGHRYVRIWVAGRNHYAHRLAWLYMTGGWPECGIDHRDGNRANNAWINLREATQAQNLQNLRAAKRTRGRTSSKLGVCWHSGAEKWRATIKANGVVRHLGLFDDEDSAHRAYIAAKREAHAFGGL